MTLLAGAEGWARAARAQPPDRVRRVGVLMGLADDPEGQARVMVFRQALQALGWSEGRNVQFIYRWSGGDVRPAPPLCKKQLRLGWGAVLHTSTPAPSAGRGTTPTTPPRFVQGCRPQRPSALHRC